MQLAQVQKLTIDKVIQGQLPAVRSSTLCLHQSPNRPQAAKLWRVTNLSLNRAIPSLGRLDQTHQGVVKVSSRQGDAFIDLSVVHRYRNVCSWTTGTTGYRREMLGETTNKKLTYGDKAFWHTVFHMFHFFHVFPYCFGRLGTLLSLRSNRAMASKYAWRIVL